jgi:hypothetical protein
MEASGRFYLRRAFEDDISTDRRAPKPMAALDLILHVYRVAEAIAVGIEFAKGMGYSSAESQLEFGFRWSKLKDRELSSWSDARRFIMPGYKAYQDVVLSKVVVPLETVGSSIFEFVHEAVCPLSIAFGGFELSKQVTEEITRQLLERR